MPSPAIPELYRSWHTYLMQRIPDESDTRLTNLILLMKGLFQAGSVQLNLVARKTPIRAKKLSIVKRIARFLNNGAVQVRPWYYPFVQALVSAAASAGHVHLVIDTSKMAFGFRLVMVSVAYHRRSLPLVWTWAKGSRGHTTTLTQLKLLSYMRSMLPRGIPVLLVGDCEFGNPLLIEYVQAWGWNYVLRQPGDNLVMLKETGVWQRLDSLPLGKGQLIWMGHVILTRTCFYPTYLVLIWQRGEKKPWFLATNLLDPRTTLRLYRRRMWIEDMFGDLNKRGFDLEASHLRHFLRLSRLTLAVCLLYLWLIVVAEYVLTTHRPHEVDRTNRCDLSLFRLGWDFVERRLALFDPLSPVVVPTFCLPLPRSLSNLCSLSGGYI